MNIDELWDKYSVDGQALYDGSYHRRSVMTKEIFTQAIAEIISSPVEPEVGMPSENSFGQWIDAEYKLPDDREEVIFINPGGHIRIGEFSDDEFLQGYWVNKCEQYLTKNIKRWMPLPKL